MNTNSTFQIGKDHITCEDFALTGMNGEVAYAIVSDGCSASKNVDFGSRVIAMSAKKILVGNWTDMPSDYFSKFVIENAQRVTDIFPFLSQECLDATLLAAWVYNKKLTVYMFGDGVFVHRNKNAVDLVHIHLTSGAPDYLSYYLDSNRKKSYDELKDNRKEVWTNMDEPCIYSPFDPFEYECTVEEGDVISVISDGINSFRKSDYTPIPWQDLIDEFTAYKTVEGEFVLRRISAFKRKCIKESISFSDDISVASIIV